MKKIFKYNIPIIIWCLFIFYLLTMSGSNIPKYPWLAQMHIDKVIHFFLFFVLSVLFILGRKYRKTCLTNNEFYILILLIGIVYGCTMEYIQPLITIDRVRDMYDALFNALGTIIGILALGKFQKG